MAEFIEDFSKALAEGGEENAIKEETEKMFKESLKFEEGELSNIFKDNSFEKEGGRWKFNGIEAEEMTSTMRSGKLVELFEKMNVDAAEHLNLLEKQKALRNMIKEFPELHLTELDEKFGKLAKNIEELNVNIENLNEISESTKKTIIQKAAKAFWIMLPPILTLTAITATFAKLIIVMKDMKGCYFYRMNNGTLEKYKIKNRSYNQEIPPKAKDYAALEKPSNYLDNCTNLTLKIRQVFVNGKDDPESKKKLIDLFGKEPTPDDIKFYIRQKTKALQDHFEANPVAVTAPFDLLSPKEKESMNCVACDTSAPIDSLSYTSRDGLASNESFNCINEVTLYDAFKNFGEDALEDVIGELSDVFGIPKILKYFVIAVILCIVGYFVVTYFTESSHYHRLEEEEKEAIEITLLQKKNKIE